MYAIRNHISGQFASGQWPAGNNRALAWCDLDRAKPFSDPESAQQEIDAHAVPGTCQVIEVDGLFSVTEVEAGLSRVVSAAEAGRSRGSGQET